MSIDYRTSLDVKIEPVIGLAIAFKKHRKNNKNAYGVMIVIACITIEIIVA
tara:strand:+ start:739 stop:891 length:153 start_codon:yes stop_codon:yes gene_type:complete